MLGFFDRTEEDPNYARQILQLEDSAGVDDGRGKCWAETGEASRSAASSGSSGSDGTCR